ncbi:MAG: hypothetical protein Q9203_007798, partial [Teloschistes exilis]
RAFWQHPPHHIPYQTASVPSLPELLVFILLASAHLSSARSLSSAHSLSPGHSPSST